MENSQKGFIPVMLTPFSANGNIDFAALTQLTEVYLQAGAAGLFANCLSSEMFELSDQERLQCISHILNVVDGEVPVVATGTFGGAIQKQADFAKQVNDLGVDAVIAITSLLAEEKDSDLIFEDAVHELLAQTTGVPFGFYECPVPYKRVLSPTQLLDFVATGRVIYHKDTCLSITQVEEKINLTKKFSNFGLYDAYMGHAVDSLKAGAAGLSCIQGNYFPELIVWLCDHFNDDNLCDEVALVQQFLIDNMDVMHLVYPISSKYFLQKRGLNISTFCRRKVGDFSTSVRSGVETLFDDYSRLLSNVNIKVYL